MEIEANKSSTNSALSELLAVANKENQMLRELVEEVRKRAEMSESALQILSNHIEKKSQKETRPSLLQRNYCPHR